MEDLPPMEEYLPILDDDYSTTDSEDEILINRGNAGSYLNNSEIEFLHNVFLNNNKYLKLVKFNEKDKKNIKKTILKLFEERIDNYIPSLSLLTDFQIKKFIKRCYDKKQHQSYKITINYKKKDNPNYYPFIFFLTKTQNKNNSKARKNKGEYTIIFSGDHFKKTCRQTLDFNTRFNGILSKKKFLDTRKVKDVLKKAEKILKKTDPDDDLYSELVKKIDNIKKALKRNKDISFKSSYFTNQDNTPKKTTERQVKLDNKISKKDFFKIYNITEIKPYIPLGVYMDDENLKKFYDYGVNLQYNLTTKNDITLRLSLTNFNKEEELILLYLTKSQIKTLEDVPKKRYFKENKKNYYKYIKFSKTQILKTFTKVQQIRIQMHFNRIHNIKTEDLLREAYKINKDLIEFVGDDPKPVGDLITFDDDDDNKNLIDLETVIPNPKVIPSYGRNILRSLLVSDKVTKTFGKVLTQNLDKAISKLNTEISSGLYHIINGIIKNIKTNKVSINKIRYFKDLITQFIYSISNNI